jgi:predicted metal-dependent hydrolase
MDKIVFVVFLTFAILLYFLFRKKERFYQLEDETSKNMLKSLNFAIYDILDNTKTKFAGYLTKLNFSNYYHKFSIQEGYSSFTENKKKIVLCMKNENGQLYSFNSLLYVLLHEIAHVINDELHHTKKFQNIFEQLLNHATRLGYYNPKIQFDSNYCT